MTVVIGAGLTGLSCAYHLKENTIVLEKKSTVGGLAGSVQVDGFTFDYTGHLLHLRWKDTTRLLLETLGMKNKFYFHQRSSWIHSHHTDTRYPFQANTYGLPTKVVDECVVGFLKTQNVQRSPVSFYDWSLQTFGEGITKHFMLPYNHKLWRTHPKNMTADWIGSFVPRPSVDEVIYGALTDQKKFFGYNATFRYPKQGGTQSLPNALASHVKDLHLNCSVESLNWKKRKVYTNKLGALDYDFLVNTMPLAKLLDLMEDLPRAVQEARQQLAWTTVYCLNLGIAREKVSDKHWIYFPEKKFPFYRVGFYSNFTPHAAPKGHSSMYIEFARRPWESFSTEEMIGPTLQALRACGLLKPIDTISMIHWMKIPCAYVIYNKERPAALKVIFGFLKTHRIESVGRYGEWKYSFMEESVKDGKLCAERIKKQIGI